MKNVAALVPKFVFGAAVCGLALGLPSNGAAATPPTKPAAPTGTASADASPSAIPQSVFVVPASPKEGRNPFFPTAAAPVDVPRPHQNTVDVGAFTLGGVTSPPKRTAIINGRTFEVGEEGEVKLPSGAKELIRCEEIRDDSAVIVVRGVRREVKFRSGF